MRIISDFHDYYDPVQRSGQDKEVMYIRQRVEYNSDNRYSMPHSPYTNAGVIAFCGRIYPFLATSKYVGLDYITTYHYKPDTIDFSKEQHKWYNPKQSVLRFFQTPPLHSVSPYMNQHPIVVMYRDKVVLNENLSHLHFQHVVDPYTAFNDIMNFLRNIARPMKPMPVIADKDKIQARGFDKYSFRKQGLKNAVRQS